MMKRGWEIYRIGDFCDVKTGKLDANASSADGTYPFFTCSKEPLRIETYSYDAECVLVAGNGDLNVKYYKGKFDAYQRTYIITLKEHIKNISVKYLYKFFLLYVETLRSKSIGGVIKYIKLGDITNAKIMIPPIVEQERIVGELDCLSGIIANKRAQLRELDTLAQSIFYTMFGDPISNDKAWQTKKLGDVALIVGGSTPSTREETNWNGDLNWVTPAELNGTLYYGETQRKITTEGARGLELLPVGTVLLSSRAPIGKLAITTVPMYCNQGFKNVVCGESINNIYVYYYLLATIENVKALGVGATFKEVSKRAVENYHILVPPIDLQKQFAEKIENIERQKELITKSIKETEDLFNSRMSYYFD